MIGAPYTCAVTYAYSGHKVKPILHMLTRRTTHSIAAGSSSIACACEFISGLWGGALSRLRCACSRVEGTCLGPHSELNPRTIEPLKRLETTRTLHGRVFKSSKKLLSLKFERHGVECRARAMYR